MEFSAGSSERVSESLQVHHPSAHSVAELLDEEEIVLRDDLSASDLSTSDIITETQGRLADTGMALTDTNLRKKVEVTL